MTKAEIPTTRNLHKEHSLITAKDRHERFSQKPISIWFTGLSGSGKSTLARYLEKALFDDGRAVYVLDGDNIRQGLNSNLGFSSEDRRENIRRVAETAKLFNDAGIIAVCAFITPLEEYRSLAKSILGEDKYYEVYLSAPLETCEQRDPNDLYKKARSGEISNFTGISAPFEKPSSPSITINTADKNIDQALQVLLNSLNISK